MKSTQVDVLYHLSGFWYVVVTPSTDELTYVIVVDTATGNPFYSGIPYVDIFTDHSIAVKNLTDTGATIKAHGDGLIGLVSCENSTTIAIIDKSEVTATLPGDHQVKTLRHATYIYIPLRGNPSKTSPFEDFHAHNKYYFCDTYDLTHLFPSNSRTNQKSNTSTSTGNGEITGESKGELSGEFNGENSDSKYSEPDEGFLWNVGWKRPFVKLGIPHICVDLLQGACVSQEFSNHGFSMIYIARRSSINPGTRFSARGLNERNYPGNEVECELIFIRNGEFWSQQWRRGSIPLRWKTTLSSKIGQPKHRVADDYMNGTSEYFKDLFNRFGDDVEVRCISLLKYSDSEHAEKEISDTYKKAIDQLNEEGLKNILFVPFDLDKRLKNDGKSQTISQFLSVINPMTQNDGFTKGTLPNIVTERQKGLLRINCADSLDRTNLATFYYAMLATARWCLQQKVGLVPTLTLDITHPELIFDKLITEFLAVRFVETGNIISKLYTNTNAIKSNAIRAFAPNLINNSIDASISVKRRVHNVINDPVRQKLIELWTNPPKLNWYHRLDPNHIFLVPNDHGPTFPRQVLSSDVQPIEISANRLVICLPCPMIPFSLIILLFPSKQHLEGVTVQGGMSLSSMKSLTHLALPTVEQPMWCRYKLRNAGTQGIKPGKCGYARFISLDFEAEGTFTIGSIKLEGRSIYSGEALKDQANPENNFSTKKEDLRSLPASELNERLLSHNVPLDEVQKLPIWEKVNRLRQILKASAHQEEDDTKIAQYSNNFDQYFKSMMNLNDTLELEKLRVGLEVSEEIRFNQAIQKCLNPWLVDARSQLIAAPTYLCAFCRMPVINETPFYYAQSTVFPGMIEKSENKLGFAVCANCNQLAENLAKGTEEYLQTVEPPNKSIPHFQTGKFQLVNGKIETFTTESTSAFLRFNQNCKNCTNPTTSTPSLTNDSCDSDRCNCVSESCESLLWASGGSFQMRAGGIKDLEVFIVRQAVILKIRIESSSKYLTVFDGSGNQLEKSSDDPLEFTSHDHPITQLLKFAIRADEDLTLHKIQVFYVCTEFPFEDLPKSAIEPPVFPLVSVMNTQYDPNKRTEVLKLPNLAKITAVQIEMVVERGVSTPLSLCIAFYQKRQLIYSKHFVLPEVPNGAKMWYFFNNGFTIEADHIRVYYLDRVASCKPHILKFVIE
ncbi:hypothetical protein TRFO_39457 [Tritrichomonas foetus]|uniref:SAC domain-containing protein n=1 Tax=Tritrichomonas foetus TaxID=1144522 RepID=A0A1J4JAT5_9EUKA|nr:hypothetical protein TRFO_39457 [Tritrichomonas foetus]|eukprot:OHS94372.1 hypothetical protein TRFO_39457 [Tritrichomonas foetus]